MPTEPALAPLTRGQRLYLGAVAGLAAWVGFWCFFVPQRAAIAIPWQVSPLCATFLGSMYLSGMTFTGLSMGARRWADIRVIMPMIAMWTGGLALLSLPYLPAFNFARPQVWIWFGAYIVYPLIALGLAWTHRASNRQHPAAEALIPLWAKRYLLAQGSLMVTLGLGLLLAPGAMAAVWPWQTGRMMLHLYSAPLLAYGLGSFILMRQHAWSEIRIALVAIGLFTGAEFAASLRFFDRLNGAALSVAVWLIWLALTTAALGGLAWLASRPAANPAARSAPVTPRWQPRLDGQP